MGNFSLEGLCCFSVLRSREAAACITAVGLQSHSSVSKGTSPSAYIWPFCLGAISF